MLGRLLLAPLALSITVLILANLVPLGGAVFAGWSVYELVLLFWAENVLIGLYQLARMLAVMVLRHETGMLLLGAFFASHYGVFTVVHGQFVVGILGVGVDPGLEEAVARLLSPEGLGFALLALAASHGFSFYVHFLRGGEWRDAGPKTLMIAPYGRIIVLHFVIIVGGALAIMWGSPVAMLALLVVLKLATEIVTHILEHRRRPAP